MNVIQRKVKRFVVYGFAGRILTFRKFGARKDKTIEVEIITAELTNGAIPIIILKVKHEFPEITTELNPNKPKGFWHLPEGKVCEIHILGLE